MGSVSADASAHNQPILLNKDVSESNSSSDSASDSPKETADMSFVGHSPFPDHDPSRRPPHESDKPLHEEPLEGDYMPSYEQSPVVFPADGIVADLVAGSSSSANGDAPVPSASSAVTEPDSEQDVNESSHVRANSTSKSSAHSRNNTRSNSRPVAPSNNTNNTSNNGNLATGFIPLEVASLPENGADNRGTSRIAVARRSSLSFFSNWANTIRGLGQTSSRAAASTSVDPFMSNSPTIANLSSMAGPGPNSVIDNNVEESGVAAGDEVLNPGANQLEQLEDFLQANPQQNQEENQQGQASQLQLQPQILNQNLSATTTQTLSNLDGVFSVRLTPIIDHSSSNSGLYFSPVIRRLKPNETIAIGRYTEKNKSAAHAPQGSSQPIVFKSKVVSRTHALLQCKSDGLWHLKDCKSSSGTFLNNVRLSQATVELEYWPVFDGDTIQLGLDYRGGSEDIYRCVKMRCEFNHSWQRKVNQYNLEIHERMKNLRLDNDAAGGSKQQASECAICLLTLDPCQALFISPCSHSWHYKCIRPVIIKSYPQFYCPNCRSMCDLETDIEDDV